MRRWLVRLLILLVILAALAAVAFEAVRRTDLPRQLVVDALREETGLRAEIDSLRTGWLGRTRVEGLTLGLPLQRAPLVQVKSLRLKHTGVLELLLSLGSVNVEEAELEAVGVDLRQRGSGRWNVQEALDLLEEAEPEEEPAEAMELPRLDVAGLRVRVTRAGGETAEVGPIRAEGRPAERAAWRFSLSLPEQLKAEGYLMTRGNWRHRVDLSVEEPGQEPLLQQWWPNPPEPLSLALGWEGRLENDGLVGRLNVNELRVGAYEARGPMRIEAGGDRLNVDPAGFVVGEAREEGPRVELTAGRLSAGPEAVEARRLEFVGPGVEGRLNGRWSLDEPAGQVDAVWSGRVADGDTESGLEHEGTLEARYSRPMPGEHRVEATVASEGRAPEGQWETRVRAEGTGPGWKRMRWRLAVPSGRWEATDQPALVMDGAGAEVRMDWPTVRLASLALPDARRISAEWEADLQKLVWEGRFEAEQWSLPWLRPRKLDVAVSAAGNTERIDVESLKASIESLTLTAEGSYMPDRPEPMAGQLGVAFAQGVPAEEDAEAANGEAEAPAEATEAEAETEAAPNGAAQWGGRGRWSGTVRGTLSPLRLEARGELHADRLLIRDQLVDDVQCPMRVLWRGQALGVESEPFDLLGGRCEFEGAYSLDQRDLQLTLDTDALSLGRVAALANPDLEVTGTVDARVELSLPELAPERMDLSGDWAVRDLDVDPVAVDEASGRFHTRGRMLHLQPIRLQKGDGRAEGRVVFNLRDGRTARAELRGESWPVRVERPRLDTVVAGRVDVQADVIDRRVQGDLDLSADVEFRGNPVGRVSVRGGLSERALTLEHIEAELLDGSADGKATVVFDPWHQSTGELALNGLDLSRLEPWTQAGERMEGHLSGRIEAGPSEGTRAPEPTRITVRLNPVGARVMRVPLGEARLTAYAGPRRLLLDESEIRVAEGTLSLWVATTRHAGGEWFTHIQSEADALNLDVLNQAMKEEPEPMPGRLSGHMSVVGPIADWRSAMGQGMLELSESDLANNAIIGSVYNALRLTAPTDVEPTGRGRIHLRLDQGGLYLNRISYFNRGVDFYGDMVIQDLAAGGASPLNGTVLGSVRPLKDLDLPGTSTFDRLLHSLQSAVSTFRVSGTVKEPKVTAASLDWAARTLRRLIQNQREGELDRGGEE